MGPMVKGNETHSLIWKSTWTILALKCPLSSHMSNGGNIIGPLCLFFNCVCLLQKDCAKEMQEVCERSGVFIPLVIRTMQITAF